MSNHDHPTYIPNVNQGILLVDKPAGRSSFSIIPLLRKRFGVKKIGHAGTLDPFATGLLVCLIGKNYTRLSDTFLHHDKEYQAVIFLGEARDTFDIEGRTIATADKVPTLKEIETIIETFQGEQEQIPPMFSAKKVGGQKLYEAARKGHTIERKPSKVTIHITLQRYEYPYLEIDVTCSKGTYIRTLAYDIGKALGTEAYLHALRRMRSGEFHVNNAITIENIQDPSLTLIQVT